MQVTGGSTDVTTYFVLRSTTDNTELTSATITNIDLQYCRSGAAPAAKVDATALAATDSAHSDNKAIEIDSTDQPGLYRVDWPDAAFAAGVKEVILTVKYSGAFTEHLRVQIDAPVNVTSLNAGQQSLTDLKDFADTGYDPSTHKVAGVVLTDTTTTVTGGATSAELAKVPKSDSNVTWNATAAAQIQSEAADALNAYDPPTKAETDALLTTALTEGYAANGAAPTLTQAIYAIHQMLMQFGISSTALTVKKLDNSTTAFVVTLDDATTPTGAARV